MTCMRYMRFTRTLPRYIRYKQAEAENRALMSQLQSLMQQLVDAQQLQGQLQASRQVPRRSG